METSQQNSKTYNKTTGKRTLSLRRIKEIWMQVQNLSLKQLISLQLFALGNTNV